MDEEEQQQQSSNGNRPDGVYEGTLAQGRRMASAEGIRSIADQAGRRLLSDGGASEGSGYDAAVSIGESPSEIFARTEYYSLDEVKKVACYMALQMESLKMDSRWADEEWVKSDDPAAAFLYFEALLRMSLYRQSRKEATFGQTGFVAPTAWENGPVEPGGIFARPQRRR